MSYLLDTNTCIYVIKMKPEAVRRRFESIPIGDIAISSVTLSELQYGIAKSTMPERNQAALDAFLLPLEILPFDDDAARIYGTLRAFLEKKGQPIGSMDMLIAAHALSLDMTLVTNNLREFQRVPKLRLEDWTQG